jgi:hypothetical protein
MPDCEILLFSGDYCPTSKGAELVVTRRVRAVADEDRLSKVANAARPSVIFEQKKYGPLDGQKVIDPELRGLADSCRWYR